MNKVRSLIESRRQSERPGKAGEAGIEKLFGGVMDGPTKLDKIIKLATSWALV